MLWDHFLQILKNYWPHVVLLAGSYFLLRKSYYFALGLNRFKKLSLLNRVVVITGASSGLGKQLAIKCYCEGAKVILLARRVEELKKLCEQLKETTGVNNKNEPMYAYLDINNIDQAAERAILSLLPSGKIDVLFNNAGISMRGNCEDTPIEVHRKVLETNYFGPVFLTQLLLDKISSDGAIVVTNSIQGKLAVPYRSAYSASKHAVQAFFDSLRCEKGPDFHILSIFAGYMRTDLGRNALTLQPKSKAANDLDQMNGIDPSVAANMIYKALINRKTELTIAPLTYKFAIFLRWLCPDLIFYILYKRSAGSPFAKKNE